MGKTVTTYLIEEIRKGFSMFISYKICQIFISSSSLQSTP